MDELLKRNDLSEELQKEKIYFYNKCPVDMSPGTINRIAWAVNKKFDEFNNLPITTFDKDLIKSGVEYDMQSFYAVRDVFREYKANIINLVKKTKTEEINEEIDGAPNKSMIDFIFRAKFSEVCPNEKMLCDILIDILYDKPNSKNVVWDMCGNIIIENLLEKSGNVLSYPEKVADNADFTCCRNSFRMKQITVGGDIDG